MGENNNDKNNIKVVLVIMAILWIIFLIGILANKPYYDQQKRLEQRQGAAMDGKDHYFKSNLR